jgi:ADP-ribose pyrophosphatase
VSEAEERPPLGPIVPLASREIFTGRTVHLKIDTVRMPNGVEVDLERVYHVGAAAIVPVTADGDVLLVRQARWATGGWLLEIPAGKLDRMAHGTEAPEVCAARELEEETGHTAARLEPLGWIWATPGFADEKVWLYLATDLTQTRQTLEADEVLHVERLPLPQAIEQALSGEMHDAKSVCGVLRAAAKLGKLGRLA